MYSQSCCEQSGTCLQDNWQNTDLGFVKDWVNSHTADAKYVDLLMLTRLLAVHGIRSACMH